MPLFSFFEFCTGLCQAHYGHLELLDTENPPKKDKKKDEAHETLSQKDKKGGGKGEEQGP